jgi:hypothetical protein
MLLYVDSQFTSPYAMSVFVCLREKGLPFDVKTVDLRPRRTTIPRSQQHRLHGAYRRWFMTDSRYRNRRRSLNTSTRPFPGHVYIPLIHTFAQERARCRRGFEVISCRSEISVRRRSYSTALKKRRCRRTHGLRPTSCSPRHRPCSAPGQTTYSVSGVLPILI